MPGQCPCDPYYNINYAMNSKKGGFVIMRHNIVRDFRATLLKKTINDFEIKPKLQKIDNQRLKRLTGDNARLDIRAHGVGRQIQNPTSDICLTNTYAHSQKYLPVNAILKKHEKEKKRVHNSRIMNVEHGTFTPLVFFFDRWWRSWDFHIPENSK